MKNIRRGVTGGLAVLALALTACGGGSGTSTDSSTAGTAAGDPQVITIGVTGAIYEDLWAPAQEALAEQGIEIQLQQFADYVTPNRALSNGDIDLNAFQHYTFLENEIAANGYEIEAIGNTMILPMHIYSDRYTSLDEIPEGATIAIPNDPTNGGRALNVLADAGLITLADGVGLAPTLQDVTGSDLNVEIQELGANTIPSALPDVDAAVINGNFALDFGLDPETAIFQDTTLDEHAYWSLIAARTADLQDPALVDTYRAIVEAFQSQATEDVMANEFQNYFIPVGWDEDLLADN